jgi:FMN phosphatase YigB (HAD superfamily)
VIDLFIFDEGGVMIRNFMVLPDMAAAMGIGEAELKRLLPRHEMNDFSSGRIDSAEFWRRFTARTGIVATENWWDTLFNPTPIPESFALVRCLAALPASGPRGSGGPGDSGGPGRSTVRVVGGTNTIDCHHEKNRRLGLYEGFHAVYASNEIGVCKPDPAFWLAILKAEGVAPEHAFFTDDSAENVQVARGLGIESRLFVDAETLRRDLVSLGVLSNTDSPQ